MKKSIIKSAYKDMIYNVKGIRVMFDFDLASLYGVETKRLKEQVRRNIKRFPEDFMFEPSNQEFANLRSQFATSSWGGSRYKPMVFTEQGVAMLSSVLNSEKAIQVNIEIMRAFAEYRALILRNKEMRDEIAKLDNKIDRIFKYLLVQLDSLRGHKLDDSRERIGFKRSNK